MLTSEYSLQGARGFLVHIFVGVYTALKRNIAELGNNPNFDLIRHDVTFPFYLEVNEIYNLACPRIAGSLPT
jgi:UDP-glucuronate decarboxylase